jgi:hypothetical protein
LYTLLIHVSLGLIPGDFDHTDHSSSTHTPMNFVTTQENRGEKFHKNKKSGTENRRIITRHEIKVDEFNTQIGDENKRPPKR